MLGEGGELEVRGEGVEISAEKGINTALKPHRT